MEAGPDTRQRILDIARDLFATQGYAGTSIAHIATRLGTTKAALYYHFQSKAAILTALTEEPLAAYARLTETRTSPEALLAAVIDTTAGYVGTMETISSDPSAQAVLRDRAENPDTTEINKAIVNALAGPRPSAKRRIRAHAAYAAAKHTTLTLTTNGELTPRDRTEILAAAMRALDI